MRLKQMENGRVLVIGGGSYSKRDHSIKGIGTCLVERLAKKGYSAILFTYYKSQEGATELAKRVAIENPSCKIDSLRFNSLNYIKECSVLEDKISNFGIPDIFVYNAGLRFYKEEISKDEREKTMAVNYYCPVFLIEKMGEKMAEEHKNGKIIVTSSVLAGKHHLFLEDYCESKGLLNKYIQEHTDAWRDKDIEISVICPGVTKTPMIEERLDYYEGLVKEGRIPKINNPEEIANQICDLC